MWWSRVFWRASLAMDPASRKLVQFGMIGLVVAAVLVAGFELKPAGILPVNGKLVVEITDAPPEISVPACGGREVTSLNVTIDSVKVHRAGAFNVTGEWVEVVSTARTIEFMQVKNTTELLGSVSLSEGTITSIRLHVTQAVARIGNSEHADNLWVPGGELKIPLESSLMVRSGLTTTIVLQPRVVSQGNAECKLTPVLAVKEVRGPR